MSPSGTRAHTLLDLYTGGVTFCNLSCETCHLSRRINRHYLTYRLVYQAVLCRAALVLELWSQFEQQCDLYCQLLCIQLWHMWQYKRLLYRIHKTKLGGRFL